MKLGIELKILGSKVMAVMKFSLATYGRKSTPAGH